MGLKPTCTSILIVLISLTAIIIIECVEMMEACNQY